MANPKKAEKAKVNGVAKPAPEMQLREEVIKKRQPLGIGPVVIQSGKVEKIKVDVCYVGHDDERFFGTHLINTGEADGLYIQGFDLGDKPQMPVGQSPIGVGSFALAFDNELKFDPAKRNDSFLISVKNNAKEPRTFSMTLFGRLSRMVPVVPEEKPKKPTVAQTVAAVLENVHAERLVDPEAVYKLFLTHAARFCHDLTGALLEAAEASLGSIGGKNGEAIDPREMLRRAEREALGIKDPWMS